MKFRSFSLVASVLSVGFCFISNAMAIDSEPILLNNPAAIDSEPILFPLDIDLQPENQKETNSYREIKVTYSTNDGRFIKVTYRPVEKQELSYSEVKDLGLLK